jgi:nitrogen fixation/metabolism regulation signal transduction histidine kinase
MGFNKYSLLIIIKVILIFLTLLGAVYFLPKPNRAVTAIFFMLLAISQVIFLIRFFNSVNRDLARFLIELKEQDTTTLYFPENLEKNFKNLKYSFQEISNEIKKSRIEKLSQDQYLNYIIENINEGLISFDEDGKIKIINKSAKHLLQIDYLNSVWDLNKIKDGLAKRLVLSNPGKHELIKLVVKNISYDFLFSISEVKIENQILKIITFQDLKSELEEKEISSWKKLMRVLTHEMMNSLTPITTLSVAIRRILIKDQKLISLNEIESEDLLDIYKNNETIENRSKGLLDFINQYRKITKIPELQKEEVKILPFLQNIEQLFSEEIKKKHIKIQIKAESELICEIDKNLIEQVTINLIKNSLESFKDKEEKVIELYVKEEKGVMLIVIQDNGSGINKDIKDDVFVPFFTTKEQGSGIGLSLSKEIMKKHKGEIYFESAPKRGTIFYLKFPKTIT